MLPRRFLRGFCVSWPVVYLTELQFMHYNYLPWGVQELFCFQKTAVNQGIISPQDVVVSCEQKPQHPGVMKSDSGL